MTTSEPATLNDFRLSDLDEAWRHAEVGEALDGANLFITGGSGFFGQWLLAVLARARQFGCRVSVTVLSRDPDRFARRCPELAADPGLTLVAGDVRFFEFPKGRFTHAIHAATDTSIAADRRPLELIDTIVDGTRRVLAFAQAAGIGRVLFTSSGAVYGPLPPDLEAVPEGYAGACPTGDRRSAYGQAKRLAEQLCTLYAAEYGLGTTVARCFAFAGPGMPMDGHFAIGNFIRDAVRDGAITVAGDGTPVRSYLYAGDLAAWLLRILVHGLAGGIYNVGSDRAVSIAELARTTTETLGGTVTIAGRAAPDGFRSLYVPAVERARRELGLEVWTSLAAAIASTATWYRATAERAATTESAFGRQEGSAAHQGRLTFVVDMDGVLASLTPGNDYRLAEPLESNIAAINRLHAAGHRIIILTARGSATGIDWRAVTEDQLNRWGVRRHDLQFGKPAADYYVDDRLITIADLQKLAAAVPDGP